MLGTRVKVQLAVLVIFILGFAAGALSVMTYYRRVESARQGSGRFNRERYVEAMTEAVGLKPEQPQGLNAILDDAREEFFALRRRLRPQVSELRQRARSRIRQLLNPEQQARFEAFLQRWDEERRAEEQASEARAPASTPFIRGYLRLIRRLTIYGRK